MRTSRERRWRSCALGLALGLAGCLGGPAPRRAKQAATPPPAALETATPSRASVKLDVPYVPTPEVIVERMLRMAKVGKDDVVYDLGCGDGRIVVTAASRYGARGVGYDLNPQRITESNANAVKAGVADRVRFVQGDLFRADLSEATVVTLYLLPDVNLKLRPKLLADLKPGTRVVSHNYGMGDWEPKEVAEIEIQGTTHYIYSWVIPEKAEARP
ncbi:MAG TPA: class I SAM-dependent methyltransferase [Pyrinomonadaceae bacterium]|nr:class I SAM-dependent methyltransferase [Pyrinomonadaceae bacterium]